MTNQEQIQVSGKIHETSLHDKKWKDPRDKST